MPATSKQRSSVPPADLGTDLGTRKKLLLVAAKLGVRGRSFRAVDLIIAAWQAYPDSFGLPGHLDEHPDSNRVLTRLMGQLGLVGRGWVEQVAPREYRLTPEGRKLVEEINGADA